MKFSMAGQEKGGFLIQVTPGYIVPLILTEMKMDTGKKKERGNPLY
jgi:hypothetical protein